MASPMTEDLEVLRSRVKAAEDWSPLRDGREIYVPLEALTRILDSLEASNLQKMQSALPAGWLAVPREPAEEMLRAWYETKCPPGETPVGGFSRWATWEEARQTDGFLDEMRRCYRALLAAIPISSAGVAHAPSSSSGRLARESTGGEG